MSMSIPAPCCEYGDAQQAVSEGRRRAGPGDPATGRGDAGRPPFGGGSHVTLAAMRFRLGFICRTSGQPVTVCGPSAPGPGDRDGEVSPLAQLTGHEHHASGPGDVDSSGVTCEVMGPACGKLHSLLVAEV